MGINWFILIFYLFSNLDITNTSNDNEFKKEFSSNHVKFIRNSENRNKSNRNLIYRRAFFKKVPKLRNDLQLAQSYKKIKVIKKPRIVGGEMAEVDQCGFQVFLDIIENKENKMCGGAILSRRSILTAAHCVEFVKNTDITAFLGNRSMDQFPYKYYVKEIHMHPNFNEITLEHDLAVLTLCERIEYGLSVFPISLTQETPKIGQVCVVAGWGTLSEFSDTNPTYLQYAEVKIVDKEKCKKIYSKINIDIFENMICARDDGRDACKGDSGSPLICDELINGIVSFGRGCGSYDFPGIYTDVSKYFNWIQEVMSGNVKNSFDWILYVFIFVIVIISAV